MAISYITNALGANNSTTSFSITLPATQAGDILILEFTHRGTGDGTIGGTSVTTGGLTWTKKHSRLYASSAFAGLTYWTRATGNHSGQTVTGSGLTNSCAAILTQYRGAIGTGDPLSDATVVGEENASGDETQAQITTATNGAWVVLVVANSPDVAVTSQACTSPGTLTARAERLSTGGTDTSIAHASAEKATAGATGSFTWAQTNGAGGSWAYAIKPQAISTYTYTGSGGGTAAGSATTATFSVYSYTGSGGAIAGGTVTAAVSHVHPYTASGGAIAGGSAVSALVGSSSTYAYTGSGGATSAGAAELARGKAYEGTGGATAAGAADSAKGKHFLATGGAAASGAAVLAKTKAYEPTGGATAGGASSTVLVPDGATVYAYTGSGGALAAGAAVTATAPGAVQPEIPSATGGAPKRPKGRPKFKSLASLGPIFGARGEKTYGYAATGGAEAGGTALAAFVLGPQFDRFLVLTAQ